jgi:tRNA(fMet)-specific endonuclease VapC
MQFLLDTNAISDLIRNPRGPAARRVRLVGPREIGVSILVAAELRYGAARRWSAPLCARVEEALQTVAVVPFESPVDAIYGDLRARLEHIGQPIGANDMLVAAHALALDCTLVTANGRELDRVDGLRWENWLLP